MMDEIELATRLRQAVAADPPVQLDLHAVVAAGRRRRRARAVAASGVLALAVAAGVAVPALLGGDGGQPDRVTVAGPAAPASPAPELEDPLGDLDLSVASPAQAGEIADRVVTMEDYRAAYGRYRACMGAGGYELEVMPPVLASGVHGFAVPDEAVHSGVDGTCYDREFRFTDMLWQTSLTPSPDDTRTDERFRECLRKRGIEPRGSAEDVAPQVRETGIDIEECLLS